MWRRGKDLNRFLTARPGDGWLAPFQCDHCWFININNRVPLEGCRIDTQLLGYIRRVNLDIMWSREPGTVKTNARQYVKLQRFSEELGMPVYPLTQGPWPVCDGIGFQLAIILLRASQEKGRNDQRYVQFDTIRKLRSAVSSCHENSAMGSLMWSTFRGDKGRSFRLSSSETQSQLFTKFMRGLEVRMGRNVQANVGLDINILLLIQDMYEGELRREDVSWSRKRTIIIVGTYLMICFGASLRGNEGLYLESSSLVEMIDNGKGAEDETNGLAHVCVPLLGRFKTETGEDKHVAVVASVTSSGLKLRLWMERLSWLLVREGKDKICGPAFCREDGSMCRSYELDWEFHRMLKQVQGSRPDLIPESIDVIKVYGTFRSSRRGSLTRATEAGIKGPDLDMVNRWRKFETSKGSRPHMSMREHYLEIRLVLRRSLTYSKAL